MDQTTPDELNRRFGISATSGGAASPVQVVAGNGGMTMVRVATHHARADIYLHGAQITSWKPAGLSEVLFLSSQSRWEVGKAMRGGVPICFPWFRGKADDAAAPAHGFVRTRVWRLDAVSADEDAAVIVCSTQSDAASRRWWPHEFHLQQRITVGKHLRMELTAKNTGDKAFHFEEALHSYFRVGEAARIRVRGLDGVAYLDNNDGNQEKTQVGDVVFSCATDNAYLHAEGALELVDPALHRTMRTEKENSATTVVWNPWQKAAAAMADLGEAEWQQMACLEAANILGAAVHLEPGEEHTMRATLTVLPGV